MVADVSDYYDVVHRSGCWGCFPDDETGELYHCLCCEEQWLNNKEEES